MSRVRLAVIGHVEWVTFARAPFVPAAGEIVHLEDPFSQPAGGGAVTAVALARMGAEVTFYTALGNDGRSRPVLEEHGVRVEAVMRDRPQTEVLALLDPAGERTLYVIGDNDAPLAGDPLPWAEIAEMDGCYFTGYDPETVRLGRQARVLVVTARRFDALVESGVRVDALVGSGRDRGERFDLDRLAERPDHVVVTDGAHGGSGYSAAPVPGPVVDTYGAGDTFVAGVLYGLASGWAIGRTLAFAAERAAEALTWRGALPPRS
jgi:ribokinase